MSGAFDHWEPVNWPSTDYLGQALDLAIKTGGVVSMRRRDSHIVLATVSSTGVVGLTEEEALRVAESLLAAVAAGRGSAA